MNPRSYRYSVVLTLLLAGSAAGQDKPAAPPPAAPPAAPPPAAAPQPVVNPPFGMFKDHGQQIQLPMIQRSVLTNVEGKINHLAVDPTSNVLYVAAKGNNTLEMLEVQGSKQRDPVRELPEPNSLFVANDLRKLVLSCAGDNSVRVFSLSPTGQPSPEKTIKFDGETDAIRFDAPNKRVYVAHGKFLGSLSLDTGEKGKSIELPAASRGFVIEPNGDRIFVNIPSTGTVAVLKRGGATGNLTLDTTWTLKDVKGNYSSSFDPATGHLFVISRSPAKFIVIDTKDGSQVASLDCIDDTDDAWWDPVLKRVYVSGGGSSGRVDMFEQVAPAEKGNPPTYKLFHKESTNVGCRTSVLVPEQRRYIVAAPKIGGDPVFLYIYVIGP